jgi:hypothetical protein
VAKHLLQVKDVQEWVQRRRSTLQERQQLISEIHRRRLEEKERAIEKEFLERQFKISMFKLILEDMMVVIRARFPHLIEQPEVPDSEAAQDTPPTDNSGDGKAQSEKNGKNNSQGENGQVTFNSATNGNGKLNGVREEPVEVEDDILDETNEDSPSSDNSSSEDNDD